MANAPFNPYIRRAWYHTLDVSSTIHSRVIFDYELLFIKDGKCTIRVEDREYKPLPGDVFLFRPRCEHSIHVASDTPLIQPHIHFDLRYQADSPIVPINFLPLCQVHREQMAFFRPDELSELISPLPDFVHPDSGALVEQLMSDVIFKHNNCSDLLDEMDVQGLFLQLLYQVLYEMRLAAGSCSGQRDGIAQSIKLYLDHNLHRTLTLDEVAQDCYVSKCYMISVFKETYGITPYQYHLRQRISKAKYMLRFTNASVAEIAGRMGFESSRSFSITFRRVEGCSPSDYRRTVSISTQ